MGVAKTRKSLRRIVLRPDKNGIECLIEEIENGYVGIVLRKGDAGFLFSLTGVLETSE